MSGDTLSGARQTRLSPFFPTRTYREKVVFRSILANIAQIWKHYRFRKQIHRKDGLMYEGTMRRTVKIHQEGTPIRMGKYTGGEKYVKEIRCFLRWKHSR